MPAKLNHEDRMRLMKFVCSFVWADMKVRDEEKSFVAKLMKKLDLNNADKAQVAKWLEVPPRAEEVDPAQVPHEHRKLFLDTARGLIAADGEIAEEERENLELLEQLLR